MPIAAVLVRVRLLVLCAACGLAACTTALPDAPRTETHAFEDVSGTELAQRIGRVLPPHLAASGFHLLYSGADALAARYAAAEIAERSLDLQYYMLREDASTNVLMERVWHASQRGVRVRLLLDDMYASGRDYELRAFASQPNVQVRIFNPFLSRGPFGLSQLFEFLGDADRLNRRMHNKLWITDNSAAILGGRNLGDEYFAVEGETNFLDLDVLAVGPVVRQISQSFDEYWNSEWAVPIEAIAPALPGPEIHEYFARRNRASEDVLKAQGYPEQIRRSEIGQTLAQQKSPSFFLGAGTALWDRPAKMRSHALERGVHLGPEVAALAAEADHELFIVSPYFVPGDDGVKTLLDFVARGVRVVVVTNSLATNDVAAVHTGYARYREQLVAGGVELHELRALNDAARRALPPGIKHLSLHAKVTVIDARQVVIGSANFDPRSALENTEFALAIDAPPLARSLRERLESMLSPELSYRLALDEGALVWQGRPGERYTTEPDTSVWKRLGTRLLGVFAPESLL
ncbi:phospholipase D family protein [Niveibacterium sp. SC-1]|uniref:phospholipase D family protein n=1 Tax=Niveibacterium sp. SC-1 TaxID=3135646 RepID=UPI00311F2C34